MGAWAPLRDFGALLSKPGQEALRMAKNVHQKGLGLSFFSSSRDDITGKGYKV